jgi:hypothetical protein
MEEKEREVWMNGLKAEFQRLLADSKTEEKDLKALIGVLERSMRGEPVLDMATVADEWLDILLVEHGRSPAQYELWKMITRAWSMAEDDYRDRITAMLLKPRGDYGKDYVSNAVREGLERCYLSDEKIPPLLARAWKESPLPVLQSMAVRLLLDVRPDQLIFLGACLDAFNGIAVDRYPQVVPRSLEILRAMGETQRFAERLSYRFGPPGYRIQQKKEVVGPWNIRLVWTAIKNFGAGNKEPWGWFHEELPALKEAAAAQKAELPMVRRPRELQIELTLQFEGTDFAETKILRAYPTRDGLASAGPFSFVLSFLDDVHSKTI